MSSLKVVNYYIAYKGDMLIAVKVSVGPVTFFRWANNTRLVNPHVTNSLNNTPCVFPFFETNCLSEAQESSLPNLFALADGRKHRFILFSKAFGQSETQRASSMIWM